VALPDVVPELATVSSSNNHITHHNTHNSSPSSNRIIEGQGKVRVTDKDKEFKVMGTTIILTRQQHHSHRTDSQGIDRDQGRDTLPLASELVFRLLRCGDPAGLSTDHPQLSAYP
jgi:hypothetical protein